SASIISSSTSSRAASIEARMADLNDSTRASRIASNRVSRRSRRRRSRSVNSLMARGLRELLIGVTVRVGDGVVDRVADVVQTLLQERDPRLDLVEAMGHRIFVDFQRGPELAI